ncbi:MAG: YgiT-type zinc finger protein [Elusimicrobia bacterium]|nr:YgiT-type zinc finger protein [Elusimicrobiota bacterium]
MLFKKCPICGGQLQQKRVEKLLKGGFHTAIIKVDAEVCAHCGERLYKPEIIAQFEKVRNRLTKGQLSGFRVTGKTVAIGA